jgi:hypothetical protein
METQLASQLLDVALGGALGDEQTGCDLAIGQSLGDEARDLSFPPGELRRLHRTGRA